MDMRVRTEAFVMDWLQQLISESSKLGTDIMKAMSESDDSDKDKKDKGKGDNDKTNSNETTDATNNNLTHNKSKDNGSVYPASRYQLMRTASSARRISSQYRRMRPLHRPRRVRQLAGRGRALAL